MHSVPLRHVGHRDDHYAQVPPGPERGYDLLPQGRAQRRQKGAFGKRRKKERKKEKKRKIRKERKEKKRRKWFKGAPSQVFFELLERERGDGSGYE